MLHRLVRVYSWQNATLLEITCIYRYHVNGGDYGPGVGCIIRAIDGTMRKDDVQCKRIAQESGILTLTNNEELISNIIEIVPSDPDRKFHVSYICTIY